MKAQIEAYEAGYRQAMQDIQNDIAENMILEKVEFIYVDAKKRTAEYGLKLKLEGE